MSQLPNLFGVAGGGHNFFDRAIRLAGQAGDVNLLILAIGVAAIVLLLLGEKFLKGRPVGLAVVALSILMATLFGLPALGVPVTGNIPTGLPALRCPLSGCWNSRSYFQSRPDVCCWPISKVFRRPGVLLRSMATAWTSGRNFWDWGLPTSRSRLVHGYPVAGGLSQSAVNDAAGARTSLALVFCSFALALCLLFFTALLTNLPKPCWLASSLLPFTSWSTSARCCACGG
jgi:MFS superfamily sulfate permease-like transporter